MLFRNKSFGGRFFDHTAVAFGSIHVDMMLIDNECFGDDMEPFVDFIRKFFAAFREQVCQLFIQRSYAR